MSHTESSIERDLSLLALTREKPLEFTQLVGGKVSTRFCTVDARPLHSISQQYHSQYNVNITHTAAEVTFDPSMKWSTPAPLACAAGWQHEVCALLPTAVDASEVARSGSTRTIIFKGSTIISGDNIARILATPRVIDIRFKPGMFFIMVARERDIVGGLAHLSATRNIGQRKIYKRRRAKRYNATTLGQTIPAK